MKKRILVIDDEVHILKLVKFILEKRNFEVLVASNGKEGIDISKKENPDLIGLDVMMPDLDGYGTAKILSSTKETKGIPIIMLSSAAQFKDKLRGIECGASDYITKPFNKDNLIEKINKHLQLW